MSTSTSQRTTLKDLKAAFKARRKSGRGPGRVPTHLRQQVLTLLHMGADVEAVAVETGLSVASLERWQRREQGINLESDKVDPPPRVFAVEQRRSSNAVCLHIGSLVITVEAKESA